MKEQNKTVKTLMLFTILLIVCANLAACGGPAGKTYKLKAFNVDGSDFIVCGDKYYFTEINENSIILKFNKDGTIKLNIEREIFYERKEILKGTWDWDKEDPDTIYLTLKFFSEEYPEKYVARVIDKELLVNFGDELILLLRQS